MDYRDGPSPHLSWSELACNNATKTPYPSEWRESRAHYLADEFEKIRVACGGVPITVGSAFRTPAYNASIPKAAKNSQHMQGRALDLYPPRDMSVAEFYSRIRTVAMSDFSSIRGLGRYPSFVHVDIRPIANNRLVVWSGARAWAENRRADSNASD